MASSLISIQSTPIPIQLAAWIAERFDLEKKRRDKGYAGTCAAMVQQIHYYMSQQFGAIPHQVKETLVDGRRWIFKSYESWLETFPWLSDYAFRKVRALLVELGLIEVEQLGLRQQGRDRTCWYTVNYEHPFLQQLLCADVEQDSSTDTSGSSSTDASVPGSTTASVDCQRIPITTSNTTDNTLSQAANQIEKKGEAPSEPTPNSSVGKQAVSESHSDMKLRSKTNFDFPRTLPKISLRDKSSASVEPWEVAPQQPYPYFLQWRALHYKNQGGHWANSPQSNAYAEFYKNRFKTAILWQEFLQFYNLALDNALALQAAGIEVKLPSCLSKVPSASPEEVAQKAKVLHSQPTQSKLPLAKLNEVIATNSDFGTKIAALVRRRTLPPTAKKQPPTDSLQQYLSWLHGDEPVLAEEARKKLTRLVMERDELFPVWDGEGRLIDVGIGQTQTKQG